MPSPSGVKNGQAGKHGPVQAPPGMAPTSLVGPGLQLPLPAGAGRPPPEVGM